MDLNFSSFVLGLAAGSTLYPIIKWLRNAKLKQKETLTNDCFLFHPQKYAIKCVKTPTICRELSCPVCNLKQLIDVIKSTKSHLDICMYLITAEALTSVVLNLFSKGIFVRVIVDQQMSDEANNSKVHVFLKEHVPLKIIDTGEIMHNKFLVIDKKKVVTGSFNWTRQAMQGNFENVVVVHDLKVVKKYDEYFNDVWHMPYKR